VGGDARAQEQPGVAEQAAVHQAAVDVLELQLDRLVGSVQRGVAQGDPRTADDQRIREEAPGEQQPQSALDDAQRLEGGLGLRLRPRAEDRRSPFPLGEPLDLQMRPGQAQVREPRATDQQGYDVDACARVLGGQGPVPEAQAVSLDLDRQPHHQAQTVQLDGPPGGPLQGGQDLPLQPLGRQLDRGVEAERRGSGEHTGDDEDPNRSRSRHGVR
jgi:hypothetical protein